MALAANVVLVNYRGYGKSSGKPSEASLKADALAVYDELAAKYRLSPENCGAWDLPLRPTWCGSGDLGG